MNEQEEAKQALLNRWYNYLQMRGMEATINTLLLPEITPEDLYLTIQVNSIEPLRVQVTREDCIQACELRKAQFTNQGR